MNKAIIVKLSHDEWEQEVVENVQRFNQSVTIFYEAQRLRRSYSESPTLRALQFCVSFLLTIKDVSAMSNILSKKHGEDINRHLSKAHFIISIGTNFLFYLKENFKYKRTATSFIKKYRWYLDEENFPFLPSDVLDEIRFRLLSLSLQFLDDLSKIDMYKDVIEDIWSCFNQLEECHNKSTIYQIQDTVAHFRDEQNSNLLMQISLRTNNNKFIVLVGSFHASGISQRLTETECWETCIIEKYDTISLNTQLKKFLGV